MLAPIILLICIVTILILIIIVARSWYLLSKSKRGNQPDFEIAVLGASGVGKTLFLSTLVRQLTDCAEVHDALVGKYLAEDEEKKLREIGSFNKDMQTGYYIPGKRATRHIAETELKRYFSRETRGTETPENLYLEVWGKLDASSMHQKILWRDIPGRYFEVQDDWRYNGVYEILNKARGICLLIDSVKFVEHEDDINKNPYPGLQNYMQAIACRLENAKQAGDQFPLWLVFTKGDLLADDIQQRSSQEWTKKISQISALASFASQQIIHFVTLVSIDKNKNSALYRNIGATMKQFYQVILKQVQRKQLAQSKQKIQRRRLTLAFLVCLLVLILEFFDAYRFSVLPAVNDANTLTHEQAIARGDSLTKYLQRGGWLGFHCFYHSEVAKRLRILQNKLNALMAAKMQTVKLQEKQYRDKLQLMVDSIAVLQKSSELLYSFPLSFNKQQEFVSKLKEWDNIAEQARPEDLLIYYRRLSQRQVHLRQRVGELVKLSVKKELTNAHEEAQLYSGRDFYPQRLLPLLRWYRKYSGNFPEIDEKYFRYQTSHWEYIWQRYLQKFNQETLPEKKAQCLREFRQRMPAQTSPEQTCPPFILKDWRMLTRNLLSSWHSEQDPNKQRYKEAMLQWFKPYLQQQDTLLIECRQLENTIIENIRRLYRLDRERGVAKLHATLTIMEDFFNKYGQQQNIREIVHKWQQRREDLLKFQDKKSIALLLKEYGCSKRPADEKWKDDIWEGFFLYLRIEIEGMPPLVVDINEGNLSYIGAYEITPKIDWKPWLPITVKFMEADDEVDQEKLEDDDTLHTLTFNSAMSILELTEKRLEMQNSPAESGKEQQKVPQDDNKEEPAVETTHYWLKIELVNADIPQWLLNLYQQK